MDACNSSTVSPTIDCCFFSGPCLVILHICVCILCRPQLRLVHVDTVNSVCWWGFCFLAQRGPGHTPMTLMPASLDKNRRDRSLLRHVCIVSSEQDSLHGHTRISLACFAVRTCSLKLWDKLWHQAFSQVVRPPAHSSAFRANVTKS